MREMVAKYPGRCSKCAKAINVGEAILWTKETGKRGTAWHKACEAGGAQTPESQDVPPTETSVPEARAPEPEPTPEPVRVTARPLRPMGETDHPLFPVLAA